MRKIEIIGKKFGKLTAISEIYKGKHTQVICLCDCGKEHRTEKYHLTKGHIVHCLSCSVKSRPRLDKHHQWTGCGEISGDFWYTHILRSANGDKSTAKVRRPKLITITIEYAWELFLKQNRKCALSGIELYFPIKRHTKEYTASLDRIDSSLGYIPGNVQWVHKHINMMKNKYSSEYFIEMCTKIAEFSGGKCEIT